MRQNPTGAAPNPNRYWFASSMYGTLGAPATELCGCQEKDLIWHPTPLVYDLDADPQERFPLTPSNWPHTLPHSYHIVLQAAETAKKEQLRQYHPSPNKEGAGVCTAGLPASWRQPCCPGCHQRVPIVGKCDDGFKECRCDGLSGLSP